MSFRLKKSERCPIHNKYSCECHPAPKTLQRSKTNKKGWTQIGAGVWEFIDSQGNRYERRSNAAMKELLKLKVKEQDGRCAPVERGGCGEKFQEWNEVEADHILPRGAGGAYRDDSPSNIQALHKSCNRLKGSRRDFSQQVQG